MIYEIHEKSKELSGVTGEYEMVGRIFNDLVAATEAWKRDVGPRFGSSDALLAWAASLRREVLSVAERMDAARLGLAEALEAHETESDLADIDASTAAPNDND